MCEWPGEIGAGRHVLWKAAFLSTGFRGSHYHIPSSAEEADPFQKKGSKTPFQDGFCSIRVFTVCSLLFSELNV